MLTIIYKNNQGIYVTLPFYILLKEGGLPQPPPPPSPQIIVCIVNELPELYESQSLEIMNCPFFKKKIHAYLIRHDRGRCLKEDTINSMRNMHV